MYSEKAFMFGEGQSRITLSGLSLLIIFTNFRASSQFRFRESEFRDSSISVGWICIISMFSDIFSMVSFKASLCFLDNSLESFMFVFSSFGRSFSFNRRPATTNGPMTGPLGQIS